ncbi:MAG: vitamin K epoxide reductase family protein [Candidatus Nanoarchaeia archaeon]
MAKKRLLKWMFVCCVLALLVTGILLYSHYAKESEFCNFGRNLNCDIVNKSIYAELFGIPVAILGLLFYIGLGILLYGLLKEWDFTKIHEKLNNDVVGWVVLVASFIGVVFSYYLFYIEWKVIMTFCIFCIFQQLMITIIFTLSIVSKTRWH